MGMIQLQGLRVGVRHLTPHVRSVIESFLYLMAQRDGTTACFTSHEGCGVELFDRLSDLQAELSSGSAARCIYLRGFESYARATMAHAVIDRPIRPSVLEATLNRFRDWGQNAVTAPNTRPVFAAQTLDPDGLLLWLSRSQGVGVSRIRCVGQDGQWFCSPALRQVWGAVTLPREGQALRFELEETALAESEVPATALNFDAWVYALAAASSGEQLFDHAEDTPCSVERSVISVSEQRDFARLSALFIRPHTVAQAAQLARLQVTTVRRFLNANHVLGKLRERAVTVAPPAEAQAVRPPVPTPIQSGPPSVQPRNGNVFARLFQRLLHSGPLHAR